MVAGRMMLLTTLFLVLINLMNNLTSNAPNSEGINAVSAWLLSCIIFVFAALVAYSGILLKKKIRKQKVNHIVIYFKKLVNIFNASITSMIFVHKIRFVLIFLFR